MYAVNRHLSAPAAWLAAALLGLLLALGGAAVAQTPDADWWSAIQRDDASAVRGLLLRHVDPNALGKRGNPALTQAVRDQSWRVYDVLRATPDVRIDEPNAHDETALMYLCILGETQRAAALIDAGAHVNRLGWTPLHYAASRGRVETAAMLIERGAIVNAPGPDGTTPLMMAAFSGSTPMARLLLAHGADATMFNLAHQTAADWARQRDHETLAKGLDEAAAQRAAQRRGDSEPTASTAQRAAGTVPQGALRPPAADGGQSDTTAKAADDKSSFSRYFDLKRFDEDSDR